MYTKILVGIYCILYNLDYLVLMYTDLLFPMDTEDVLVHLQQVAPHWWEIGRELGIPEEVLRRISDEKRGYPLECNKLMVREWLSSLYLRPCWYFLIKALEKLRMETTAEWIENAISMHLIFFFWNATFTLI